MKNLRTKLIYALYILLCLVFLQSCTDYVEIETEQSKAQILKGTYYVRTNVWVRDWKGYPITLESRQSETVTADKIDSVQKTQYKIALKIKQKLEAVLKKH
jgi:hypothetical protein